MKMILDANNIAHYKCPSCDFFAVRENKSSRYKKWQCRSCEKVVPIRFYNPYLFWTAVVIALLVVISSLVAISELLPRQ